MAIINNVAYSWSMIRISIPALDISEDSTIMQGVSEIKWNKTRRTNTTAQQGVRHGIVAQITGKGPTP